MKLIAGLGNPGPQYRMTRHNIGFRVVDVLADRLQTNFKSGKGRYIYGDAHYRQEKVILLKPLTYMNLSGEAISHALHYWKIETEDLLVVVDDINLPLGKLRARAQGSAGGQKGLFSIISILNDDEFPRLRFGIDQPPPGQNWADYVLQTFEKDEIERVGEMIDTAADACLHWIENGIEAMMSRYN